MSLTVTVAKDLEDLIPGFLKNRRKEFESLRTALQAGDFEQMRVIGHRMKGVGNSFGFADVSRIGVAIEAGARASDRGALDALIVEYGRYLESVTVVFA